MGRPVTAFQIVTSEPDREAEFYASLLGWSIDRDNALGHRRVSTGSSEGIAGGIWPAPPEAGSFVQLFVEVDDVGATVERAEELGARVIIPPQHTPEGDEMAVIHDPAGIPLALIRPGGSGDDD